MKYHQVEAKDNMKGVSASSDKPDLKVVVGKEDRKRVDPVVTAAAVTKKRGLFRRFYDATIGPGGAKRIAGSITKDIIIPTALDLGANTLKTAVDMAFYGESRQRPSSATSWVRSAATAAGAYTGKTNYQAASTKDGRPALSSPPISRHPLVEYWLDTREDCKLVLDLLMELASKQNYASVADYYDLIKQPTEFTDNDFGWYPEQLRRASFVPYGDKWIIRFPETLPV